ncbi:DUF6436 domain-containing protein [Colwellia echini]|uniref:DUF6436 domain-containing protein n=1 Tax=Colwellia echini TaxID=1982103 RepID=A0ABY3MV70_9GAMM|nr:DUF6436 domain-containing protein [Colwellia echini]TYK65116.1 hypothetical protein CWS31_012555 [Colwellia echini]
MRTSNSSIPKFQLGIIFIWLSFTVVAFAYFSTEKLVRFDEDKKLVNVDYEAFSSYLSAYSEAKDTNEALPTSNNKYHTVLHFSTPNCDCQKYSDKHIKDINKLAVEHSFIVKNIVLHKDTLIPSTPSIALLDDSGVVIYFGPYGQGIACSQTSGYAQTMLNNYIKGYSANIVIKEAKGCYCKV